MTEKQLEQGNLLYDQIQKYKRAIKFLEPAKSLNMHIVDDKGQQNTFSFLCEPDSNFSEVKKRQLEFWKSEIDRLQEKFNEL